MDAAKLDDMINEFEESVKVVKSVSELYEKIEACENEILNLKEEYESNLQQQRQITDEMKAVSKDIHDSVRDTRNELDEHRRQLNSRIDRITSDIQVEIRDSSQKLEANIEKRIDQKSDELEKYIQQKSTELKDLIKAAADRSEAQQKKQFIMTVAVLVVALAAVVCQFINI